MEQTDVYLEIGDPKGYMRGWEGWDHPERKYTLSLITNGSSLLDVGCGGGITYESIKKHEELFGHCYDIRYKGVDYSQKFIDACKEMFPEAEWEVANINKLNEPDNSWDIVYLRNMLENCEYYKQPIKEAFRVAKKAVIMTLWQPLQTGDCIIQVGPQTWGNRYDKQRFYKFLQTFKVPVDFRFINVPTPEGGRQLSRYIYVLKKGLS